MCIPTELHLSPICTQLASHTFPLSHPASFSRFSQSNSMQPSGSFSQSIPCKSRFPLWYVRRYGTAQLRIKTATLPKQTNKHVECRSIIYTWVALTILPGIWTFSGEPDPDPTRLAPPTGIYSSIPTLSVRYRLYQFDSGYTFNSMSDFNKN